MCNPMEQLISKVNVCFLFQNTKKCKNSAKNNNVSSKTETKVCSRKKFPIIFKKNMLSLVFETNGALFSNFRPHCMIFIAEAYFFDIKYTCIYHHR